MRRAALLLILTVLSTCPSVAQDGWFIPNPRKWRVPYYGSNRDAHQVKKMVEATISGLKVHTDRRSGTILFEGEPRQLKTLQKLVEKLPFRSPEAGQEAS